MPRFANKRDSNHGDVVKALRQVCGVENVIELFDCDVACRYAGTGYLIEVKACDQTKKDGSPKAGAIRDKQKKLKQIFGDRMLIVFSAEGALRAIGAV